MAYTSKYTGKEIDDILDKASSGGGVTIVNSVDDLDPNASVGSLAVVAQQAGIGKIDLNNIHTLTEEDLDVDNMELLNVEKFTPVSSVNFLTPTDLTNLTQSTIVFLPKTFSGTSNLKMLAFAVMPEGVMFAYQDFTKQSGIESGEYTIGAISDNIYTIDQSVASILENVLNSDEWIIGGSENTMSSDGSIPPEQIEVLNRFFEFYGGTPANANLYIKKDQWEDVHKETKHSIDLLLNTIPTKVSQLDNDVNYITKEALEKETQYPNNGVINITNNKLIYNPIPLENLSLSIQDNQDDIFEKAYLLYAAPITGTSFNEQENIYVTNNNDLKNCLCLAVIEKIGDSYYVSNKYAGPINFAYTKIELTYLPNLSGSPETNLLSSITSPVYCYYNGVYKENLNELFSYVWQRNYKLGDIIEIFYTGILKVNFVSKLRGEYFGVGCDITHYGMNNGSLEVKEYNTSIDKNIKIVTDSDIRDGYNRCSSVEFMEGVTEIKDAPNCSIIVPTTIKSCSVGNGLTFYVKTPESVCYLMRENATFKLADNEDELINVEVPIEIKNLNIPSGVKGIESIKLHSDVTNIHTNTDVKLYLNDVNLMYPGIQNNLYKFSTIYLNDVLVNGDIELNGKLLLKVSSNNKINPNITRVGYCSLYGKSFDEIYITNPYSMLEDYSFSHCSVQIVHFPSYYGCINMSAFMNCDCILDCSQLKVIPVLNTGVTFSMKTVIVPDNLYDEWIVIEGWNNYVDKIIKKSEWDAQ